MRHTDFSDDLTAAADALDRLCAKLMIACDVLCAVAVFGTFAMTIYHAVRFAARMVAA